MRRTTASSEPSPSPPVIALAQTPPDETHDADLLTICEIAVVTSQPAARCPLRSVTVTNVALAVPRPVNTATRARTRTALAVWTTLVTAGAIVAMALTATGHRISVDVPPLHASFDPRVTMNVVLVVLIGGLAVVYAPRVAMSLRWPRLLLGSAVGSVLWSVSLASIRGVDRIASPVRSSREYLAALPQVHDLGAFLAGFVENIRAYPVHVQGHPPGTVVFLTVLRNVGLGGADWAAGLFVIGGALAVPAVLLATRDVAGEQLARRAAPFLVIAPTAIWLATSADALYTGLSAWGAALVIIATGNRDRRSDVASAAGGVLLAVSAFCSYGLVLVALVPIAVAVARRRVRPILVALAGSVLVTGAFAAVGFWWFAGLAATRARYDAGIAASRPYFAFLIIDLAAFALALGAATAVAFARLRDRALWLLVGAALAAVVLADLSGMSKGEVERIWLPFTPWLLVANAALARSGRIRPSGWLAVQAGSAIVIESLVHTPW